MTNVKDYKSIGGVSLMENICFEYIEQFVDTVIEKYEYVTKKNKLNDVTIIAKYEEAKKIIQELMMNYFSIRNVELYDAYSSNYEDEFIITLANLYDCADEIYCEPMKRKNGYINDKSTTIFILDNCSSAVLKHCNSKDMYEVAIVDDCEDYEDCEDCDDFFSCPFTNGGNLTDTSDVSSTYKINGKTVSKEEYEEKHNEIEDVLQMYTDNVKDMILRYCDVMDRFNDLQRTFW